MQRLGFKQYLTENAGRVETLRAKYKPQLLPVMGLIARGEEGEEVYNRNFDHIAAHDPSKNKQYLQWMLNLIVKRNIQFSDLDKVKEDLTVFERVKQRVPVEKRDVNRYKAYQDLYDVVQEFGETKSGKEMKREEVARFKKDILTIYDGPGGSVYVPHTRDASCYLGRGTRWCTAATNSSNYFDHYNKTGKLVIFILDNGEKYQYHAKGKEVTYENYINCETPEELRNTFMAIGEFMDAADRTVNLSDTHPLVNSLLFQKLAENPRFGGQVLAFTMRAKAKATFNKIKSHHKRLLDEMKGDAPDILEMTDNGSLSRFKDIAELYKFILDNY